MKICQPENVMGDPCKRCNVNGEVTEVKNMLPKILVRDPVVHKTWKTAKFTTYLIYLKTEHPSFHLRVSAVRRRFSELRWLLQVIKANHPRNIFPAPPSKKIFGDRFGLEFITSRMKDIESFLNELVATDTVLSDIAFHLFMQTDLTTSEIDAYLQGDLSEDIVERTWQNSGYLHMDNCYMNTAVFSSEAKEIVMNEEDLLSKSHSQSSFESSVTSTVSDENTATGLSSHL